MKQENRLPPAASPLEGKRPWRRYIWLGVAWSSFTIGMVAIVIPGLPTTEFILLSAFAASKSSPRLHAWLSTHKTFGPIIQNWQNGRTVSRKIKLRASLCMCVCAIIMALTVPHRWLVIIATLSMATGSLWLWRRPEA